MTLEQFDKWLAETTEILRLSLRPLVEKELVKEAERQLDQMKCETALKKNNWNGEYSISALKTNDLKPHKCVWDFYTQRCGICGNKRHERKT